jgi:hypothetical protein
VRDNQQVFIMKHPDAPGPGSADAQAPSHEQPEGPTRSAAIPPLIRRSQEAFRSALPGLLQRKKLFRWWVAYHGDEQLGIAKSEDELYEAAARKGLKRHEFIVRCIVPEMPRGMDITPAHEV